MVRLICLAALMALALDARPIGFFGAHAEGRCLSSSGAARAQELENEPPAPIGTDDVMTPARMEEIVRGLDEEATTLSSGWAFRVRDVQLRIVFDNDANRMRIISVVSEAEALDDGILARVLQANFDSALDARYALAQDYLWSVFLHPLDSLTDRDLVSGIAQTINLALTFGSTYSSGALVFWGRRQSKAAGGRTRRGTREKRRPHLERFQVKWNPVHRQETRKTKNLEPFCVSVKTKTALVVCRCVQQRPPRGSVISPSS